jgi:hypothetical protein
MRQSLSFAIRKWFWLSVGAMLLVVARPASATVTEPDGTALPQPAFPDEVTCCVTGRGFAADADTLAGLFMYRGDNLNASTDAHQTPGTFSPRCGFTGQIVLKGGDCQNALGWYNATDPATAPAANQIYQLVPANLMLPPPMGLMCIENGFCPLATHTTSQVGQHTWTDVT